MGLMKGNICEHLPEDLMFTRQLEGFIDFPLNQLLESLFDNYLIHMNYINYITTISPKLDHV